MKIIEIDNAHDVCERALATLFKWREKQGREATYANLAVALNDDLVQRRDLVEAFCCHIYPSKKKTLVGDHNFLWPPKMQNNMHVSPKNALL